MKPNLLRTQTQQTLNPNLPKPNGKHVVNKTTFPLIMFGLKGELVANNGKRIKKDKRREIIRQKDRERRKERKERRREKEI